MTTRRLSTVLPALLALLGLATACTTAPVMSGVPAGTTERAHQQVSLSPLRSGTAAGSVTLAFAGDVHFTGRTAQLLSDPATAFGPIAAVLKAADFTAVNLETAVTGGGTPQPKTYHFRTVPAAFTALRDGGVDLVTMANNHVLDYGQAGLADTLPERPSSSARTRTCCRAPAGSATPSSPTGWAISCGTCTARPPVSWN